MDGKTTIDLDAIKDMKYAELRSLAKSVGIKANMKAEKLVSALEDYANRQMLNSVPDSQDNQENKNNFASDTTGTDLCNESSKSKRQMKGNKVSKKDKKEKSPVIEEHMLSSHRRGKKRSLSVEANLDSTNKAKQIRISTDISRKSPVSVKNTVTSVEMLESHDVQSKCEDRSERRSSGRVKRRGTYDKDPEVFINTPKQDLLDSMKDGMSSEERKENLLKTLESKVKKKMMDGKDGSTATGIPRFAAFALSRKAAIERADTTPASLKKWNKIHKKTFDKMDSLDVYLSKKKARIDALTSSSQKSMALAKQTRNAIKNLEAHNTPKANKALFKSPAPDSVFKPKITSVSKMNTNFSSKTQQQTPGQRKSMTPMRTSRMSGVSLVNSTRKSMGAAYKFSATSDKQNNRLPLKSIGQKSATKKPKFDLAASLAKPITWNMHKGKLKPIETKTLSSTYADHSTSFRANTKEVKVLSKAERRANLARHRAGKRFDQTSKRRGIHI